MTRVNVLPPELLLDEWLIAEYRELKRIPNNVRSGRYRDLTHIPTSYRMGMGHEKFFIDKLLYLKNRHDSIRAEMTSRFHKDYDIVVELEGIPAELCNDWTPIQEDFLVNIDRLYWRFHWRRSEYHYRGKVVDVELFDMIHLNITS